MCTPALKPGRPLHTPRVVQKWRKMPCFLPKTPLSPRCWSQRPPCRLEGQWGGRRGCWGGGRLGNTCQCPISTACPSADGAKLPHVSAAGSRMPRFATGHQAWGARPAVPSQPGLTGCGNVGMMGAGLLTALIIAGGDWFHLVACR